MGLAGRTKLIWRIARKTGGVFSRACPVCGFHGHFEAFGDPPRWDAKCPQCGSLERHRLFKLFLDANPAAIGSRVVHFAPEPAMAMLLRATGCDYRSADLFQPADLKLNLEKIDLPDSSVDTFVLLHVLEHVDDRAALPELHRCLTPGGRALIMIPIVEGWPITYENPAVSSARERELHFGQFDHVRDYGRDVRDRIANAGFMVEEFTCNGEETAHFGLFLGEKVFSAIKPEAN
jgi:SAM-dependent methyltransferase